MLPENRARKARQLAEKSAENLRKRRERLAERCARLWPRHRWRPHPWRSGAGCVCAELGDGWRAVVVIVPGIANLTICRGEFDEVVKARISAPDLYILARHAKRLDKVSDNS